MPDVITAGQTEHHYCLPHRTSPPLRTKPTTTPDITNSCKVPLKELAFSSKNSQPLTRQNNAPDSPEIDAETAALSPDSRCGGILVIEGGGGAGGGGAVERWWSSGGGEAVKRWWCRRNLEIKMVVSPESRNKDSEECWW
ncbi:hypothetical protein Tco_0370570 [Tanacetum coccineum]